MKHVIDSANPGEFASLAIQAWRNRDVIVPAAPGDARRTAELVADFRDELREVGAVVFTSGSTSDPKGIVMSRASIEYNSGEVAKRHRFSDGVHATCLAPYHCNALFMSIIGTELAGGELAICAYTGPVAYFDFLRDRSARTAAVVPTMLWDIVRARPPWPSQLEYLITAAAPLTRELAERFRELYGPGRLVQGYGQAEAVNFTTVMPDLQGDSWDAAYLVDVPPVGVPLPGTEVDVDIDGGKIRVRSPSTMRGYLDRPDDTTAVLSPDGWMQTGDLGWRDADGYLHLHGREKEMIKRGGRSVWPIDVECREAMQHHVHGLVVVRAPHSRLVEVPAAIVESVSDLVCVSDRFDVGSCDVVPRTSTGKPQRSALSDQLPSAVESVFDWRNPSRDSAAWQAADRVHTYRNAGLAPTGGSASTESVYRSSPGLWKRLMNEAPMGEYAAMAAGLVKLRSKESWNVLELGAGVGNTTRHLVNLPLAVFRASDLRPHLIMDFAPSIQAPVDFDEVVPGTWHCVVAVNALHCSREPSNALGNVLSALTTGGLFVMGEGQPSALFDSVLGDAFSGLDGWDGFRRRDEWLIRMADVGFKRLGYAKLSHREHDLGGIIWGYR